MDKLTPELIERMMDEFFCGDVRKIYLSAEDGSFAFEHEQYSEPDHGTLCGYSYQIKNGAFKMCIIFDDFNEVIKLNANGSFIYQNIDEDEDDEYPSDEEKIVIYDEWDDDCLGEEMNFYEALDNSVKSFFLPVKFVMNYYGVNIYTQEKIKSTYSEYKFSEDEMDELVKEYSITEKSHQIPETGLDIAFIEQIIQAYDNPFEILETIAGVHDLHGANIGYTYNGFPVCHDYGGGLY